MRYSYARIPKFGSDISVLASKYRQLRLSGLQLSPESFAAKFDQEKDLPLETWIRRLQEPGRETFICFASRSESSTEKIDLEATWIAQTTILGPLDRQTYALAPEANEPPLGSDEEEERWQMTALFTLSDYRGKGIAKDLCRHIFQYLNSYRAQPAQVRLRIMVKPTNTVVVKMYSDLGFSPGGLATLYEALTANADTHLIPANAGPNYHVRQATVMFRLVDKNVAM